MSEAGYIRRRSEVQEYFDRTALDAWKRLTGSGEVSGIRATVRAGRQRMREAILARFPANLSGWHVLDAGCGAGQMSVALARRGASVTGVDLSPQMIEHASKALPAFASGGSVNLVSGDMLDPCLGGFDAVVAMDSIIHYQPDDAADAIARLAMRTRRKIVFTHAPRTVLLSMMHAAGKLFPRGDRSPAIVPVSPARLLNDLMFRDGMSGWRAHRVGRVSSGFYISEALEVHRP